MVDFCIVSADYNWLVRRGGLIILRYIEGTCEVLFDLRREEGVPATFCDGSFLTDLM
jgi:hypothetical protein